MGVFYLLAAPSTPAAVRDNILDRAQHERISYADARKLINKDRPDRSPPDRRQELRDLIAKMSRDQPDDPLVHELQKLLRTAGQ